MVAEKRISKQGAHDADHLEEDDVDEGEGDVPDDGGALCKPGAWNFQTGESRAVQISISDQRKWCQSG